MILIEKLKNREKKEFDLGSGSIKKTFNSMWIPTIIAMIIVGALVVFDSMFVSMGFGPWKPFEYTGEINFSSNAYASLGAAGISSVQPYFLIIASTGGLVGAGTASKLSKAKATGNDVEYQKIMDSFIPQNIYWGTIVGIILILLAKPLIYIGSGAQSFYLDNWWNSPSFRNWGADDYWNKFFEAGGMDHLVDWFDNNKNFWNTSMDFANAWDKEWMNITGLELGNGLITENGSDYLSSLITEFINNKDSSDWSYMFASAILAETDMAAGHLLQQATYYLQIQALGAIPFMMFTSIVFILRVDGKAHYSILFNLVGLFTNIGLDFILVNILGGNMIGAVVATVFSQIVGSYLAINVMNRKLSKPPKKINWTNGKKTLFSTAKDGISLFALNLSSILLQWGTILSIGISTQGNWTNYSVSTSGFQAFFASFSLFMQMSLATTVSMLPIVTYNHAAKNYGRVDEMRKYGYKIMIIYSSIISILGIMIPGNLSLVSSKDSDATSFIIQSSLITFWAYSLTIMSTNWLQSRGEEKWSFIGSFIKPVLIAPLTIAIGLGFSGGGPGFGSFPFIDGTPFQNGNNIGINVAMFWAGPALDLLAFSVIFFAIKSDFILLKKQMKAKISNSDGNNNSNSEKEISKEIIETKSKFTNNDLIKYSKKEILIYAKIIGLSELETYSKSELLELIHKKRSELTNSELAKSEETFLSKHNIKHNKLTA